MKFTLWVRPSCSLYDSKVGAARRNRYFDELKLGGALGSDGVEAPVREQLSAELTERNMRLFGAEVMPALRNLMADPDSWQDRAGHAPAPDSKPVVERGDGRVVAPASAG